MFDLPSMPDAIVRGIVLSSVGLMWVIALVRMIGTRTLSKMTAFDFLVTLSTGSLLATASASSSWTHFVQALVAITTLMLAQLALARLRRGSKSFRHFIENEPLLLVSDGRILENALRDARVSREDVMAKLRQANIASLETVTAVVLETTGDISIITGTPIQPNLLVDVRGESGANSSVN